MDALDNDLHADLVDEILAWFRAGRHEFRQRAASLFPPQPVGPRRSREGRGVHRRKGTDRRHPVLRRARRPRGPQEWRSSKALPQRRARRAALPSAEPWRGARPFRSATYLRRGGGRRRARPCTMVARAMRRTGPSSSSRCRRRRRRGHPFRRRIRRRSPAAAHGFHGARQGSSGISRLRPAGAGTAPPGATRRRSKATSDCNLFTSLRISKGCWSGFTMAAKRNSWAAADAERRLQRLWPEYRQADAGRGAGKAVRLGRSPARLGTRFPSPRRSDSGGPLAQGMMDREIGAASPSTCLADGAATRGPTSRMATIEPMQNTSRHGTWSFARASGVAQGSAFVRPPGSRRSSLRPDHGVARGDSILHPGGPRLRSHRLRGVGTLPCDGADSVRA